MKQLLFGNLILLLFFTACVPNFTGPGGGKAHCSQYTYSQDKGSWVDSSGNYADCTIVDNNRIFSYFPGKGCDYWREVYALDETVKFNELPIKIGSGKNIRPQTYCVKQQYVSHDNSGQVVLIDGGIFCFREHPEVKGGYSFASCEGVKKKAPEEKKPSS